MSNTPSTKAVQHLRSLLEQGVEMTRNRHFDFFEQADNRAALDLYRRFDRIEALIGQARQGNLDLKLVAARANAMQKACEAVPGTMAAILALEDEVVEKACEETEGVVVAANYNCPGQLVISGEVDAINTACEKLKEAGARRALVLPVGGAFHSPLMEPARAELAAAIEHTPISDPVCPVYQNVDAHPHTDPARIKVNLIHQLTSPVRWTQTMEAMINDGVDRVIEVGPGKVLQGLFKKANRELETLSA